MNCEKDIKIPAVLKCEEVHVAGYDLDVEKLKEYFSATSLFEYELNVAKIPRDFENAGPSAYTEEITVPLNEDDKVFGLPGYELSLKQVKWSLDNQFVPSESDKKQSQIEEAAILDAIARIAGQSTTELLNAKDNDEESEFMKKVSDRFLQINNEFEYDNPSQKVIGKAVSHRARLRLSPGLAALGGIVALSLPALACGSGDLTQSVPEGDTSGQYCLFEDLNGDNIIQEDEERCTAPIPHQEAFGSGNQGNLLTPDQCVQMAGGNYNLCDCDNRDLNGDGVIDETYCTLDGSVANPIIEPIATSGETLGPVNSYDLGTLASILPNSSRDCLYNMRYFLAKINGSNPRGNFTGEITMKPKKPFSVLDNFVGAPYNWSGFRTINYIGDCACEISSAMNETAKDSGFDTDGTEHTAVMRGIRRNAQIALYTLSGSKVHDMTINNHYGSLVTIHWRVSNTTPNLGGTVEFWFTK